MARSHLAGGHIDRRKKRCRAVPPVLVAEARKRPSVWKTQVALGSLQRLNVGPFVGRKHHCVLRRVQIEADYVRRLGGELRSVLT